MQKNKIISLIIAIGVLVSPTLTFAQSPNAGFNPNKLIEDAVFSDIKTFGGAAGVQKFLESKGSILANTSPDFLVKLKEPMISLLKSSLDDPNPNLDHPRTAAELIWDVSQSSGLNPQVILVTLEKEQSLIRGHQNSDEAKRQKALDRALGFGCPDSGGCEDIFAGFYFQLFGNFDAQANRYLGAAKSLMKSFSTPGGRGPAVDGSAAKVGQIITLANTLGGYDGVEASQQVTLSNNATAALYRYTPHVFNGNYNFWRFFNEWFRYPNGTLITSSVDNKIYIILNGVKQQVVPFVAQARGLNLGSVIQASPTEFESYPTDKILGPVDNTVVNVSGNYFVFIANVKHPASSYVISQRGLNAGTALSVSDSDAAIFETGSILTPNPGSVLKGSDKPAIYLVADDNTLKLFTPFTFGQYGLAKRLATIPQAEIDTYPKSGFVAPLPGTVFRSKSDLTAYVLEGGLKRPLTAELFKNRGFTLKQITVLSDEEVAAITTGPFAVPKEGTWFKVKQTGAFYYFKAGERHYITAFVAKQRSATPDYTFDEGVVAGWTDGAPLAPKDKTLLKGDKDGTVYVVENGQLRGLTLTAFKARRYSFKNIVVLPQVDVDRFAKGDVIEK